MSDNSTPARLVQEARRLFARAGYAGTSIRLITRRARANLGAVTYHFGSKEKLYHAVLAQAVGPLVRQVSAAAAGGGSALDRVEAVMRAYFAHLDAQPDIPGLMLHEMALGRPLPPPVREAVQTIAGILGSLVAEGQRDGTIRPGDPLFMTLSVLAQPVYFALARPALARLTEGRTERPEGREALRCHAAEFARRGLAARAPDPT